MCQQFRAYIYNLIYLTIYMYRKSNAYGTIKPAHYSQLNTVAPQMDPKMFNDRINGTYCTSKIFPRWS